MPVMDGHEAAQIIRTSSEFGAKAHIPMIALTAHAMDGDREKFLSAGMDDYIAKPVNLETLKEAIRRVMNKRSIQ
jgi:CheY-like chemotaxis protein